MNDQQRSSTQVTLEDLLRVKRAERPNPEFWHEFERTLRAKQLAAIVEKRPWWQALRLPQRWVLPAGAAALLGVSFVSVSTVGRFATSEPPATVAVAQAPAGNTTTPEGASKELMTEIDVAPVNARPLLAALASDLPAATEALDPVPAVEVASNQEAAADVPNPSSSVEPAPTYVAMAEPAHNPIADLSMFFERATATLDESFRPARQPSMDPLAQLQTPRDARRARLLAFASDIDRRSPQYSDASNVIRSRERITNHLNDEALYDSIRRLDVKGNGVSIQF